MDYETSKNRIFEKSRRLDEAFEQSWKSALERHQELRPEWDFFRALYQNARGNSSLLISHLRSERPITSSDREFFAQVLEGALQRKPKRGRPAHKDEREVAMECRHLYGLWRAENKRCGFNDHGLSNRMKDDLLEFVIAKSGFAVDPEKVRTLMDRGAKRR